MVVRICDLQLELASFGWVVLRAAGIWSRAWSLGFHDVDDHSGEVYDGTDWPGAATDLGVSWSVVSSFDEDEFANALRLGTLYNFRFESNGPPASGTTRLELFRPGQPGDPDLSAPHNVLNSRDILAFLHEFVRACS